MSHSPYQAPRRQGRNAAATHASATGNPATTATTATTGAASCDGPWASPTHKRTVLLVLTVVATAILFDGYDLVVYGAVLPTLLADPSQIGALTPETAGTLGAWALIGVLVGALTAGAVGDKFAASGSCSSRPSGSRRAWPSPR